MAIEKTSAFIELLRTIVAPRLTVVESDVVCLERILMINECESPSIIASRIPFSSVDRDTAKVIVKASHRTLADNGTFIVYQLTRDVTDFANPYFGAPTVEYIPVDLPPQRVLSRRKAFRRRSRRIAVSHEGDNNLRIFFHLSISLTKIPSIRACMTIDANRR
ncbi:hypothetical protein CEE69_01240 [Rhodopirellula bahusiensis]|uniref:Uncharacterized protein n=1 Tax=Rhodopirellula bahusiensis TaxID=2014065 RepID=A0A2G1WDE5_9BACT|nr:hypothetical protein CEE69_01240 [Rhodopirellula bahusiensis]